VQRSRVSCNRCGFCAISCLAKRIARQSDNHPVASRELGLSAVRWVQGAVKGLFPCLLGLAGQLVQAGQAAPQAAGTHLYTLLFTCCTPAGAAAQHRKVWCHVQIRMLTCTTLYSLVVLVLTQMYSVACASASRLQAIWAQLARYFAAAPADRAAQHCSICLPHAASRIKCPCSVCLLSYKVSCHQWCLQTLQPCLMACLQEIAFATVPMW